MSSLSNSRLDGQPQPEFPAKTGNPRGERRANYPESKTQRYANLPDDSTYLNTQGCACRPQIAPSGATKPALPSGGSFQRPAYRISKY